MNKDNLVLIRDRLKELVSGHNVLAHLGICGNVTATSKLHAKAWLEFQDLGHWRVALSTWKYFSGSSLYPIKSRIWLIKPSTYYIYLASRYRLWQGRAGKRRVDLCEHLIAYIDVLIKY